jgi:hypothetical protein
LISPFSLSGGFQPIFLPALDFLDVLGDKQVFRHRAAEFVNGAADFAVSSARADARPPSACFICGQRLGSFRWAARTCAGKPFGVLIALPAEIRDALAAEKGEIALHARLHRAAGEVAELLPVPLAVQDIRPERREVEVRRNVGETFVIDGCGHGDTGGAVKGLSQGDVIHVVIFHARFEQHPDYFRKRFRSGQRGGGGVLNEFSIHDCLVLIVRK